MNKPTLINFWILIDTRKEFTMETPVSHTLEEAINDYYQNHYFRGPYKYSHTWLLESGTSKIIDIEEEIRNRDDFEMPEEELARVREEEARVDDYIDSHKNGEI